MAGYGRGYYGEAQLQTTKSKPRSWFTIVAVVGLGAATVWLLWPRSSPSPGLGRYPQSPQPQPQPQPQAQLASAASVVAIPPPAGALQKQIPPLAGALQKQLQDDAMARGFATVEAYENSLIASVKGLQDAGVQVMLAPNLQHLAPKLLPGGSTST